MLGRRAADAIGQTLELIIPERFRGAHWTGFRAAIARGATRSDEIDANLPLLRADGTEGYYAMRLVFLVDAFKQSVGAMGIFTEIDGDPRENGLVTLP